MTGFKPGQEVVGESGLTYKVVFGPYSDFAGHPSYLVVNEAGAGVPIRESALRAMSEDPRRVVVATTLLKDDDKDAIWDEQWKSTQLAYLRSADAILEALDSMEPPRLKEGDKIRILQDFHNCADVMTGDVYTVSELLEDEFFAGGWGFKLSEQGFGWKRVK